MLLNAQYQTFGEKNGKPSHSVMFIVSLDIYKPTSGEENCISSYFRHIGWDNLLK